MYQDITLMFVIITNNVKVNYFPLLFRLGINSVPTYSQSCLHFCKLLRTITTIPLVSLVKCYKIKVGISLITQSSDIPFYHLLSCFTFATCLAQICRTSNAPEQIFQFFIFSLILLLISTYVLMDRIAKLEDRFHYNLPSDQYLM